MSTIRNQISNGQSTAFLPNIILVQNGIGISLYHAYGSFWHSEDSWGCQRMSDSAYSYRRRLVLSVRYQIIIIELHLMERGV